MFDTHQPTAANYPDLVRAGCRSRATMTLHLRDIMLAGGLNGDPEHIAHLFWAGLHGALMLHYAGMLGPGQEVRPLINALVTALGRAIFDPPPAAGGALHDPGQAQTPPKARRDEQRRPA